jgi:parallel beta-helix repeat protein
MGGREIKLRVVSGIMLTLLLIGMLALAFNIQSVKATGTIYIRADGSVEGTTFVASDDNFTYTFTDNINGSIIVERDNIVVDGAGYTLQGAGSESGIDLSNRSEVTIKNIEIKAFQEGISLYESSNNSIFENKITNNEDGISFYRFSNNNSISRNNITNNNNYGIVFNPPSRYNSISENYIAHNNQGIWLESSGHNNIFGNNITANNYNGIKLNHGSNNTIYKNNITNNDWGFVLEYSSDTSISMNRVVANNYHGITLSYSTKNRISENNITDNESAIGLWYSSKHNSVFANNITNNDFGIGIHYSSNNSINANSVRLNTWQGIHLEWSSNNTFSGNNLIDNTQQANIGEPSYANFWDNGIEGNYWSDYNGTDYDQDGIGGSPYIIDANNRDNYPLMGMFSNFNTTLEYRVQTICNSSISDFQFNGTAICFSVTGENDTNGFCRICIPRALMNENYKVFVNGTEVPCNLLPCSNTTHNYLYFTYNHSTQEVIIIPEFPTWTSILLLLIVLTVAIVIYKRRHACKAFDSSKTLDQKCQNMKKRKMRTREFRN